MQNFLSLNQSLRHELTRILTSPQPTTPQTLLQSSDTSPNAISTVLDSTTKFRDILGRYLKFSDSIQFPGTMTISLSPECLGFDKLNSSTETTSTSKLNSNSASTPKTNTNLEITEALLLLINYTLIIRLLNILYHHIHQSFLANPYSPLDPPNLRF